MFQIALLAAALFGGGYALKKVFNKQGPTASGGPLTSKAYDEFLELRSDGCLQFNRDTAISILGWLGSVTLKPVTPQPTPSVHVSDLVASADGSPPPAGALASKLLVSQAKAGKVVLVSRDVTVVGRPERRAVWLDPKDPAMLSLAGKDGAYAILIVPAAEDVEPTLPPLPGYTSSQPDPIPGGELPKPAIGGDELPLDLRRQVDDLLKKSDGDPDVFQKVADQLRLGGYLKEARLVADRAEDLVALSVVKANPKQIFVIPAGHPGAIALAKKLTGDEKRVAELIAQNPVLTLKNAATGTTIFPWTAGQVVRLPPSWGA